MFGSDDDIHDPEQNLNLLGYHLVGSVADAQLAAMVAAHDPGLSLSVKQMV